MTDLAQDDIKDLTIEQLLDAKGWQQRYKTIIDWGNYIVRKDAIRCDQYRIHACESSTWLAHHQQGEIHQFYIDSDSRIVKGLAAILLLLIDEQTATQIQQTDIEEILSQLGLTKHLSRSRSNGFYALMHKALSYVISNTDSNNA